MIRIITVLILAAGVVISTQPIYAPGGSCHNCANLFAPGHTLLISPQLASPGFLSQHSEGQLSASHFAPRHLKTIVSPST